MHSLGLALAASLAALVSADLGPNDVSSQCQAVCAPVVQLSQQCDVQTGDGSNGDIQERSCFCTAPGANIILPQCEACLRQYPMLNRNGRPDDDANKLLSQCGFSSQPTFTGPTGASTQATTTLVPGSGFTPSVVGTTVGGVALVSTSPQNAAAVTGAPVAAVVGLLGALALA